jgi:protease I
MSKTLIGKKIACLVANGFSDSDVIHFQKLASDTGASLKFICPNIGLVSGWTGQTWGMNYAVDKALNESLGADYDYLLVPSGQRSIDKLKISAHTNRFLSSFLSANKPTILFGDALKLLIYNNSLNDCLISGPSELKKQTLDLGGKWSGQEFAIDHALFTSYVTPKNVEMITSEALNFMLSFEQKYIAAA